VEGPGRVNWLGKPIDGRWCSCKAASVYASDGRPVRELYHHWDCHAVPMPPATYVVRIVGVTKAHWEIRGWEQAYSLAQTLRRAHADRWVDVKLDGVLFALLEPQAVVEDPDQMQLEEIA
jgi:hypothetical protein